MAKTIELLFNDAEGKVTKLVVDNPKEPVDPLVVKQVIATVIAANRRSTNRDAELSNSQFPRQNLEDEII